MGKANNTKYRFDVYTQRENGLSLVKFCKDNGISVNSMINHLIVSFLLNKHKYAFNFVDNEDEQQVNNQPIKNDIRIEDNEDDNDNFPDLIKELLTEKEDNIDYSF
jgi:hypothetical protein